MMFYFIHILLQKARNLHMLIVTVVFGLYKWGSSYGIGQALLVRWCFEVTRVCYILNQSGDFPSESPHFGELNIEYRACSLTTPSLSRALPSMTEWPCPKPANATQMCRLFQACTLTSSFGARVTDSQSLAQGLGELSFNVQPCYTNQNEIHKFDYCPLALTFRIRQFGCPCELRIIS